MQTDERQKKRRKKIVLASVSAGLVVAAVLTVGLVNYFYPFRGIVSAPQIPARGEGEMRFHFLDVGQADCTIVEFPDGKTLVVDAGSAHRETEDKIYAYLKGLNYTSLSFAVTHADLDHFGGFSYLLEKFDAEKVYLPALSSELMEYTELLERVEAEGCEVETFARYGVIASGGAYAVCISPRSLDETDDNDASAVLCFSYAGVNTVLASDISGNREDLLAAEYGFAEGIFDSGAYAVKLEETDILKVAHHGSGSSSTAEWLSLLSPKEAVISCGRGNPYNHPATETLTRLNAVDANIYRTDMDGDILLTISPDGAYRFQKQNS